MMHSSRGLLHFQDEFSGFFANNDRYSGGGGQSPDRPYHLSTFDGGHFHVERVKRGTVTITNNGVSRLGGIQVDKILQVSSNLDDDGLIQRVLPVMLRPQRPDTAAAIGAIEDDYRALVWKLFYRMPLRGVRFDPEAQKVQERFFKNNFELRELFVVHRKLGSHLGKYNGYFGRLCLLWHLIETIDEPQIPPLISASVAMRVEKFVNEFLFSHAVAFYYDLVGLTDDYEAVNKVARYILAKRLNQVTSRDVQREAGLGRDREVLPILQRLEAFGWCHRVPDEQRNSSPCFLVNPKVHAMFAEKARAEEDRRRRVNEMLSKLRKQTQNG